MAITSCYFNVLTVYVGFLFRYYSDPDNDKPKIGRSRDEEKALTKLAISGRIGRHRGTAARTYHCNVRGVTVGSGTGSIDYLAREGDYDDREDLESLTGDVKVVKDAAEAIDKLARIRKGKTAEKVLMTIVSELPLDSTHDSRKATAEALVKRWEAKGHKAVVAVHTPQNEQPHLHLAVTARPVSRTESGWQVDRTPGQVALRGGKLALMQERKVIADIINSSCKQEIQFFPGRDIKMEQPAFARERKPKRRIPERDWIVDGVRDPALTVIELHRPGERATCGRSKAPPLAGGTRHPGPVKAPPRGRA